MTLARRHIHFWSPRRSRPADRLALWVAAALVTSPIILYGLVILISLFRN